MKWKKHMPHCNMKNTKLDQTAGLLHIMSIRCAAEMDGRSDAVSELKRPYLHSSSYETAQYKQKMDSPMAWMSKFSKKAVKGIKDHVSLGTKISETVKGKLSLGAKILQPGGAERVFKKNFSVEKGEKLLRAFQCYLSTTVGPITGLLFISTNKIAFRSSRSINITTSRGNLAKVPYKVMIPLGKVKRTIPCENSHNASQKYIQIVTVDEFEFWFMGFVSYERSLKCLRRAISKLKVEVLH